MSRSPAATRAALLPARALLALLALAGGGARLRAEDWPTYRHDAQRTAVTTESLQCPLTENWQFRPHHAPEPAWEAPRDLPVEGILELGRTQFDEVYHVAVAGQSVYLGTVDQKLLCLDLTSGKPRWQRLTGGAVRLAPTWAQDRVYFGTDDGSVYCLDAKSGNTVWQKQVGPGPDRLLGHGRMVSRWPVRTGVLVDGGVAYYGAGIFPAEGTYVEAANAADGALVWRNDTACEVPESGMSPQGYLLAATASLYVPHARSTPGAFERRGGRYLGAVGFGKTVGGTAALIADDQLYTGTEEIMGYRQGTRDKQAWFTGRQLLVTRELYYVAGDKDLAAFKRQGYPQASVRQFTIRDQKAALAGELQTANLNEKKLAQQVKTAEAALAELTRQAEELAKAGKQPELAALAEKRQELETSLAADHEMLTAVRAQIAGIPERQKALDTDWTDAGKVMESDRAWQVTCECPDALILAGDTLYAGGLSQVKAVDVKTGTVLWTGTVEGRAKGLAVASGRLLVSTTTGAVYCFGPNGTPALGVVAEPAPAQPPATDPRSAVLAAAAERVLKESGVTRGYGLVLGWETGALVLELARRTELLLYVAEPDPGRAESARQLLNAAGLYGARVFVDGAAFDRLPYADSFANLIVSERVAAGDLSEISATEVDRVLKPCGGVLLFGQPAVAAGPVQPLTPDNLRAWAATSELFRQAELLTDGGTWLRFRRGTLPGAGNWTHEYANAGNTACGDDVAVRCPLGLLWFGRPGPLNMISRHRRAAAPLTANGVLFVQGENVVMAYDAYNGLKLWERAFPNVVRDTVSHDCSNLAADTESFYVVTGQECHRLDAYTGETLRTYTMPDPSPGLRWGYLACADGTVFGSRTAKGQYCDALFALDAASGTVHWQYAGKGIPHPSVSVDGGRVFLVEDRSADSEQRRGALSRRLEGVPPAEAERILRDAPVRFAVCLDAKTGRKLWDHPTDLTGGIGGLYWSSLGTMATQGVVVLFGVYSDGHFWKEFFAKQFETRRVIALAATDGHQLWEKTIGYRVRPLIVGNTLHAEPWAYDLRTGEQRLRTNPVTGYEEPWQYARPGHHCGCPAAAPNVMFFRSGHIGYFDLEHDTGTMHFGGQRTGCWINFIMGNGLVMIPEASSGCMCAFPNMCTVVFKPRQEDRTWVKSSLVGGVLPVNHFAINLGAPGDREDANGTLWLAYPRPGGSLVLSFDAYATPYAAGGPFVRNQDFTRVEQTPSPWLYTSGYQGLRRLDLPLTGPGDGAARYTVRLHFAELEDAAKPGDRVFDIKLQGQTVQAGFDPVAAAGGVRRAVVREFTGVTVDGALAIELVAKEPNPPPTRVPVLAAIEISREQVLSIGIEAPTMLLNRKRPQAQAEVKLRNHRAEEFTGTLRLIAPDGFAVAPAEVPVRVAARGGKAPVKFTVSSTKAMPVAKYDLLLRLVRADGQTEAEKKAQIDYIGDRDRVVVKVAEDAYVAKGSPKANTGSAATLLVDGGDQQMGDISYTVTYLKFRFGIAGRPVSALLRLFNGGNPTSDGGVVHLVEEPWNERQITFENRPKPGALVGRVGGPVEPRQTREIPLDLSLEGRQELSLAVEPANCDGVDYTAREGGQPAELQIEYQE